MMKIKISLILPLAFVCLLSCSDDNEFDRSGTYIPSSEDIENDSLVNKNDSIQEETSLVENGDVIEASKRFFAWYKSNNSEFYGKQNNCVKVVDEFYEIDSSGVTAFANFLETSGFFSNSYINTMKNEWFDNCAKQMISDKEKHLENINQFNVKAVIAINRFISDTDAEVEMMVSTLATVALRTSCLNTNGGIWCQLDTSMIVGFT